MQKIRKIRALLEDEIKQAKNIKGPHKKELPGIVLTSLKKLEQELPSENKSMFCSYLEKAFPKKLSRDIRRYCPLEYKRPYTVTKKEKPRDLIEQYLFSMQKVLEDCKGEIKDFRKNCETGEIEQKKLIAKSFLNQFPNIDEFKKWLVKLKEDVVELETIKKKIKPDKRLKVDEFPKTLLRIMSFEEPKRKLGKRFGISKTRVSQILNNSRERDDFLIKLLESDPRLKDRMAWFKENLRREKAGLEPIPLPP